MLDTYLNLIKAHERLILVCIGAFLLWHFYGSALRVWDKHDSRAAVQAQAQSQADQKAAASAAANLAVIQQQNNQLMSKLAAAVASANAALAAKQREDAALTAPQAAARLNGQAIASTVVLPLDTARGMIAQLDEIPDLKLEVADTQAKVDAQQKLTTAQADLITSLGNELSGQNKACKAQVAELKVKAHRSWRSGFKWGFITGITLGLIGGKKI